MVPKINSNSSDTRSSDGVSLLISLLMRFPQIGTLQFDSKHRLLTMNFMFIGIFGISFEDGSLVWK